MPTSSKDDGPLLKVQRTADRLALALEDVGFDVGQAFPALSGGVDTEGSAVINLGRVSEVTASRLAAVLSKAAQHGVAAEAE